MKDMIIYISLLIFIMFSFALGCMAYEYDNLKVDMQYGSQYDTVIGIKEMNGKFTVFVIDKKTNTGYGKECQDFTEAFQLEKILKEHRRQEYLRRNK